VANQHSGVFASGNACLLLENARWLTSDVATFITLTELREQS